MNSWQQTALFGTQEENAGSSQPNQPVFQLRVPGRLPSWNEILGMEHWARYKFKDQIQLAFLSALRACANDSLTKTTSVKSSMSIAADTLESYRVMVQVKRKLKSDKKKQTLAALKKSALKSSESKAPF